MRKIRNGWNLPQPKRWANYNRHLPEGFFLNGQNVSLGHTQARSSIPDHLLYELKDFMFT